MASMLMLPVNCNNRLRTGNTPHLSGNGVANSHKADMPTKKANKVNLIFFMVVFFVKLKYKTVGAYFNRTKYILEKLGQNYR